MRKNKPKKLVLHRETLAKLEAVAAGYCSNSTLSAQVSLCAAVTEGADCYGHPYYKPYCASPDL